MYCYEIGYEVLRFIIGTKTITYVFQWALVSELGKLKLAFVSTIAIGQSWTFRLNMIFKNESRTY